MRHPSFPAGRRQAHSICRTRRLTELGEDDTAVAGEHDLSSSALTSDLDCAAGVTTEDDVSALASQLADLTRVVEDLGRQITALGERATNQQEATEAQQERIELVARELADVSSRLQLAADALRAVL
jgi:predicted  nucleic acid-binding Zn-ribbon protein